MKSITIHGIDEVLAKMLRHRAREEKLSMNKTVKKILEEALGVKIQPGEAHRKDFEEFCGIWSAADYNDFEQNIEALRKTDVEDWE